MLGPLMLDLEGLVLSEEERELILHPAVGGLIFFARNYHDKSQLAELVESVRAIRPELLLAVDHEGGRVQRFRDGFTELPTARAIGERYQQNRQAGLQLAYEVGATIGRELSQQDLDFSFTPVVDLDKAISEVIGTRSFHRQAEVVSACATALMRGLAEFGMPVVIKHFPGHGSVSADSHHELPHDDRSFEQIAEDDLRPFIDLIAQGAQAIMPAHIVFSQVDSWPVCFSSTWLKSILRERLGFRGIIISDDLSMQAAAMVPEITDRTEMALQAGCDLVLLCNDRSAAIQALPVAESFCHRERSERLSQLSLQRSPIV